MAIAGGGNVQSAKIPPILKVFLGNGANPHSFFKFALP